MRTSSEYPIKEACLDYFTAKDTFHSLKKVVITILAVFIPSCIAYGFTMYKVSVNQESSIGELKRRQAYIDSTVNVKLDTLINRKAVYYVR